MIVSEGNKLARLSEVKTLIDPAIKQYSVTLSASHNTSRKKKQKGISINKGRRIDVNNWLMSGFNTKMD